MGEAERRREISDTPLLVVALCGIGLLLRAVQLPGLDLNVDEGMYFLDAAQPTLAEVWQRVLLNPHPPANTVLLHFLLEVSRNPTFLKLVSLLSGTALIWLGWLFGRDLLGRVAGLTLATAIAFSPQLVALSATLRAYSPAFALLLAALLYLSRFLERFESRDLARFAAFELLTAPWLYALLVPLLGMNLALAAALLRRRAPRATWVRAVAFQLPLAAYYLFSYFVHIRPHLGGAYAEHVAEVFRDQFSMAPRGEWLPALQGLLSPVTGTFHYLAGDLGGVAFALALLGAAALALRRRWIPLLLLLSPLPFAYALNIAGRLPFGEVRQSAYCFPFFFGLVGAFIERVLGVVRAAPRLRTLALALVSLLGAGYAAASLVAVVRGPQTVDGLILGMTTLTGFETSTRTEDLDAVARLLEEEATRDDLILVSYQSLVTLSIHLGLGPGTPRVDRPARYTYKGRAIHYSPKTGNSFTAGRFLDALADVEARHPGVPARRVIVPLTGWELYSPSLGERIPNVYRPDGAGFSWLRDVRNARGQPIATILDGDRARALERLPDPEELRRFISYLRRRVAGVP